MSQVKFERETVRTQGDRHGPPPPGPPPQSRYEGPPQSRYEGPPQPRYEGPPPQQPRDAGPPPPQQPPPQPRGGGGGDGAGNGGGEGGKQDFMHKIGNSLTKASTPNGYLAWYLKRLQENPLRVKMLTLGSLAALQEFLASWIAKDRSKHGHYFTSRVPKMAVYGALVSAPLGHVMITILQKLFAGRTSLKAKILQIIVSNLVISPIQNGVYLFSMALIAGARTIHQIRATVRAGFMPVMKVSWITSPIALAFAQAFLPHETWVPFFNFVGFVIGTYINAHTKKKRLQALRRKYQDGRDYNDGRSEYQDSRRGGPGGY